MIITEYKYFTIKIKNQSSFDDEIEINPDRFKTYKLLYQIIQYEKLNNQNKKYINRLRKSGVKVITKKRKIDGQIFVEYFKLYAKIDKSFKFRKKLIDIILKKEVYEKEYESNIIFELENYYDKTRKKDILVEKSHTNMINANENFIQFQNRKNVNRKTTNELMDEYLFLLDIISSYLMCDTKLASCINNDYFTSGVNQNNSIKKAKDRNLKKLNSPTPKQKREEHEDWKNKNKLQYKRWKKSKTYKLNNIYSYVYDEDIVYWDWQKGDWRECKSEFNTNIKRLIDPNKPYTVEWCLVDTENKFKFNNVLFNIGEELQQYKVKNKAIYIENELNNFTNESEMEKILSFYVPTEDKYYFFDENINRVDKYISKIE